MSTIAQDQFFGQVFQAGLSDPASQVYLPGLLLGSTNPSLNPYTVAELDLGNQSFGSGIDLAVTLTQVSIAGIPNVSVAPAHGGSLSLADLTVTLMAQCCVLDPPPAGVGTTLVMSCQFSLYNATPAPGTTLTGTFSVELNQAALSGVVVLSGTSFSDLALTVTALTASVPTTATLTPTITFTGGGGGFWATLLENYLQEPSTVQTIVGQLNTAVESALPSLSDSLTTLVRSALQQQVGAS